MIKFPVRYNREDESVEDADFNVIAHPFILPGMSVDEKHEIGAMIEKALNILNEHKSIISGAEKAAQADFGFMQSYLLAPAIKSSLSERHKKSLDRIERKHKKFVAKLIAKYLAVQGGVAP